MYLAHRRTTVEYQSAGSYLNRAVLWQTNVQRRTLEPFQLLQLYHFAIEKEKLKLARKASIL